MASFRADAVNGDLVVRIVRRTLPGPPDGDGVEVVLEELTTSNGANPGGNFSGDLVAMEAAVALRRRLRDGLRVEGGEVSRERGRDRPNLDRICHFQRGSSTAGWSN
jgi:hypothetical protein